MPDMEKVIVLVEPADGEASKRLERDVSLSVANAVGVRPAEVLLLPPGTVQKTTSGKLRRAAMRKLYISGALDRPPQPKRLRTL